MLATLGAQPQLLEQSTIEFGEWLPDLSALNNPGATEALNVIPSAVGYEPFKDIAPITGLVLPGPCKGLIVLEDKTETTKVFAATNTDLFIRTGAAFVSQYHNTDPTISQFFLWQFIPFGDNLVAVHPKNDTQVASISGGGPFATLGGTPPRAKCGARVGDFLVLGNLDNDGTDGRQAQRIRWSGFDNIASPWVTDPTTQADFQDMPSEGGSVVAIVGRETGTVFQERQISRMQEVGLPTVFDIATVEQERGALCVGGVVDGGAGTGWTGTCIYFLAQDGFYMWNGYSSQSISNDKVSDYFFGRVNLALKDLISGALDLTNSCVWWAFPTKGPPPNSVYINLTAEDFTSDALETEDGLNIVLEGATTSTTPLTEILIYSYKNQRWSHAVTNAEIVVSAPTSTLPVSIDDMHDDLDTAYSISFDDLAYNVGTVCVVASDGNHNFGPYNGQVMQAVLDTAESTAPGGKRVFVASARPLVDADTASLLVETITRDQLVGEPTSEGGFTVQELNGEVSILSDARYIRFRTLIPAGVNWMHALGIEIWRKTTGRF